MKISDLSGAPALALNFSAAPSFGTTIFGPKLDGARFWRALRTIPNRVQIVQMGKIYDNQ
jgi:hypothetical protein